MSDTYAARAPQHFVYRLKAFARVVDGGTVDLDLDLGFSITLRQRVRLYGIDTQEIRSKDPVEKAKGQERLGFLCHIEKTVPEDHEVHLIVDNYGTHKHAKVRSWLAERPRFHVHYTLTYASWLNQVERWFGITQRAIRRGSFSSVKEMIAKIEQFVAAYNKTKAQFNWTAMADSILAKLQRLCSQISGTAH